MIEDPRYSRHYLLPEVGREGQQKLQQSRVLLVGAGGLGSPLALYLAAAGVGQLGLVDFDRVDLTNLQRQVLYGTSDVGRPKLEAARDRLLDLNPGLRLELHSGALRASNAREILTGYDVVVDGTDNFATRYLVNDACTLMGKPNVYGSIYRFEGQISLFHPAAGTPCYRCLYPEPPPPGLSPSCAEAGVLGVLPGVVGCLQATETLKLLLGIGTSLGGRLLLFDALTMQFQELRLRKDPACPVCGIHPRIVDLQDAAESCASGQLSPQAYLQRWQEGWRPVLVDVREESEWQAGNLAEYGAIWLPLGRIGELPLHQEVVVHCQSGARSEKARQQLLQAGFPSVYNLAGGMSRWQREITPPPSTSENPAISDHP